MSVTTPDKAPPYGPKGWAGAAFGEPGAALGQMETLRSYIGAHSIRALMRGRDVDLGGSIIRIAFSVVLLWSTVVIGGVGYFVFFGDLDVVMWGTLLGAAASRQLFVLLALKDKMPLWINMGVCLLKPIVLIKIFGTPQTDEGSCASCIKMCIVAPFFVMLTTVTMITDFGSMIAVLNEASLTEVERALMLLAVVAVSSNVQTVLAFSTMLINYQSANGGNVKKALLNMAKLQSWNWVAVMGTTTLLYLPLLIITTIVVLPGFACYWWATAPFFAISLWYWRFLRCETCKGSSGVANVFGTSGVTARSMLGTLGQNPPRCKKGHVLLPVTGGYGWACGGTDDSAIEGAVRRKEMGIVCDHPCGSKDTVDTDGERIRFRCVICNVDLCRTCYAEQTAWMSNAYSELGCMPLCMTWIPQVSAVHAAHALDSDAALEAITRVMRIEEAKQRAVTLFPLVPAVGACLPVFVPLVVRFYLSEGYLNAVLSTWNDRHILDFAHALTDAQLDQGQQFMHIKGTRRLDVLLHLLIRWIQTLDYII